MKKNTPKTALQRNPELYRARLSCKIGRDALEGTSKPPANTTSLEYAVFLLLHAVEDIAAAMEKETKKPA